MDTTEPNVDETYVSVPLEFLQAVSYIGVDFGFGKYALEDKWIDLARRHYEASIKVD